MPKITQEELDAKVAKLPRWAKDHIYRLEMNVREARTELLKLSEGANTDEAMVYRSYQHSDNGLPTEIALPHGMLTVKLGKDRWNREHNISITHGLATTGVPCIEVRAETGPLRIIPQVSNAVSITTLDPIKDD